MSFCVYKRNLVPFFLNSPNSINDIFIPLWKEGRVMSIIAVVVLVIIAIVQFVNSIISFKDGENTQSLISLCRLLLCITICIIIVFKKL